MISLAPNRDDPIEMMCMIDENMMLKRNCREFVISLRPKRARDQIHCVEMEEDFSFGPVMALM